MRGGRRAFFSIFVLLIHQHLMLDARQLDGFIAGLFEEVLKFRTIKIVENSFLLLFNTTHCSMDFAQLHSSLYYYMLAITLLRIQRALIDLTLLY